MLFMHALSRAGQLATQLTDGIATLFLRDRTGELGTARL